MSKQNAVKPSFVPRARRWIRQMAGPLAALVMAATVAVVVAPLHGPVARAEAMGQGGDFVPLTPAVPVFDSRTGLGTGGAKDPLPANVAVSFPVTGLPGAPSGNVRAVLLNVVTAEQTARTFIQVWPDDEAKPIPAALVAQPAGPGAKRERSNAVVVTVPNSGILKVSSLAGTTHVAINVQGYFTKSADPAGGRFVPVTQTRIIDSRTGLGTTKATIPAGGSRTVSLAQGPIPSTASAAFVNISSSGATADGWLSVAPQGVVSNVNVLGYAVGSANTGAAVPLGVNGNVTFVNHSTGVVNLVVDAHGYFATRPAVGAGLRAKSARLLDTTHGVSVPANGTIDIPLLGVAGLPTRGLGAIVANFTVLNPQAGGFLRAWPKGEVEPLDTSLTSYPTVDQDRDSMGVIRVGAEGTIRVHNVSNGTIDLAVDLQGWFESEQPPVPVEPFSRVSAMQASVAPGSTLAPLEFAFVDTIGNLMHVHQRNPEDGSTRQTTAVSGTLSFTGRPALTEQADGRMVIAAQTPDSNMSVATEVSRDPAEWGSLVGVGGSMASQTAAVRTGDGRVVLFATSVDGELWMLPQDAVNGSYTAWRNLGAADLVGTPTVLSVAGGIRVFGLDSTGALKTAEFSGGGLSPWVSLGGSGLTGSPAVAVAPGPRLRVFVRAGDGSILTQMQDVLGEFPMVWDTVPGFTAVGSPAAVLSPGTGRAEVVARGADGKIYSTGETAQGTGLWRAWVVTSATNAVTDPTVFQYIVNGNSRWAFAWRASAATGSGFTITLGSDSNALANIDRSAPAFSNQID